MARQNKQKQQEPELEEMRKRALQPFKQSLTDEDVREFEEKIRLQSIEYMKNNKEELNDYEKKIVKERSSFIHTPPKQ